MNSKPPPKEILYITYVFILTNPSSPPLVDPKEI